VVDVDMSECSTDLSMLAPSTHDSRKRKLTALVTADQKRYRGDKTSAPGHNTQGCIGAM
jgi:hypothetical protein